MSSSRTRGRPFSTLVPGAIVALVAFVALAGCTQTPSAPAAANANATASSDGPMTAPGPYEYIDTFVESFDGTPIAITLFKPVGADAEHQVPMLLHGHGGGGVRCRDADCAEVDLGPPTGLRAIADFDLTPFTDAGFGIVSMSHRGYDETPGPPHFMSPFYEARDTMAVIDHLATLEWVYQDGPGDPRLGGLGVSYGGWNQWLTALEETRLHGATRFDALAPEIAPHDISFSVAPNDVPRSAWLSALAVLVGRYQPEPGTQSAMAAVLADGDFSEWYRHSPAWYADQNIRLDVPVFLSQGVPDIIFPLNDAWNNHRELLTPEARAQSILLAHRNGHVLRVEGEGTGVGAQEEGNLALLSGSCDTKLFPDNRAQAVAWYRKHLLGEDVDVGPRVQLSTFEGKCLTFDDLPSALSWTRAASITPQGTPMPTAAGARLALRIADGPLTLAGIPLLNLSADGLALDGRLFFALGIGPSDTDLRITGDQWMPARETVVGGLQLTEFEMAGVVEEVPGGSAVWLVISPWVDQFATSGSRAPGGVVITDAVVGLPIVPDNAADEQKTAMT